MCKEVVRSPQAWQRFLESACRNYRLRFDEQLLVFAQRPDATAVLEFEKWNRRFGRHINRGAKGIAVFENAEKTRIKHYFDISDTSETEHARPVPIWKYKDEYEQAVIETLENTFGELEHKGDMIDAVISAADNATEDNTLDYISDLIGSTQNSFLEELDEDGISTVYRTLIKNSVAYMILSRLGISTDQYFGREEFAGAVNFNTPETLNAVGFATSDIAEIALNEVSKPYCRLKRRIAELQSPNRSAILKPRSKTKGAFQMTELTYRTEGEVQIPNLILPTQKNLTLSRYGQMRKRFLKEKHRLLYYNLLTTGKLDSHLTETDERAKEMEQSLMKQMAAQEGLTEERKAADQMAWVQGMNNLKQRVQEIVLSEVIYQI